MGSKSFFKAATLAAVLVVITAGVAHASDVTASVVDTDGPVGSVSLAPGTTGDITIKMSVTGRQDGTATFKVNRDWTLGAGGTFTGANPATFTVNPRANTDGAAVFTAAGHVTVPAGTAPGGPYTLAASAFDITNSNATGAKLNAGSASSYSVTVTPPPDSTPPVITRTVTGTAGTNGWYTSNISVNWTVTDPESSVVIDSGCGTQTFTIETETSSSCTAHSTGGSATHSFAVKIDKTAPVSVALAPAGTLGANDWFTSNVTVSTSGVDTRSGVTCTADQTLSSETSGTTVNGSCTNGAGLTTKADPITVKIDKTGPSAQLSADRAPDFNDWYTDNVTVSTVGSDSVSGPVVCDLSQLLDSDTAGTTLHGSCTNQAGLSTQAAALTVKVDKTDPTAHLSVVAGATTGDNGWYTSPIEVDTLGSDTVSEPVTCTARQLFTQDSADQLVTGACTNQAGKTQAADPLHLMIDRTAPVNVRLSVVSGTPGAHGWYTSDVVVRTAGTDPTSGVTCTADTSLTDETDGTLVTGSCTNGAGLTTTATPITVKIDKTPPSADLTVTSGTVGSNGWYRTSVTVTSTGADSVSNPVTCTAAQTFSANTAGITVQGSCTNEAGLSTNAPPLAVKIDKDAPANVAFVGISNGASYYFGSTPSAAPTCTATDSPSGLDVCAVDGWDTSVGTHTLTATARDNAGNVSSAAATYTVKPWTISGFYQPVSMDVTTSRVVNTAKNGSTIPLKFELFSGATELTSTSAVAGLKQVKTNCADGSLDDPLDVLASGATSLRYDTTAGQFIYNWKTPSTANSCYDVTLLTQDGTGILAHFKLK
jgi:hypothetical protein